MQTCRWATRSGLLVQRQTGCVAALIRDFLDAPTPQRRRQASQVVTTRQLRREQSVCETDPGGGLWKDARDVCAAGRSPCCRAPADSLTGAWSSVHAGRCRRRSGRPRLLPAAERHADEVSAAAEVRGVRSRVPALLGAHFVSTSRQDSGTAPSRSQLMLDLFDEFALGSGECREGWGGAVIAGLA